MASRHREIETNEARYGRVVLRSTRGSFCHYPSKYKVSIEQNIDELKDQLYCANDEKSEAYIREQISEKIRELEQFSIEANEYRRKAVLCLYEKSTYWRLLELVERLTPVVLESPFHDLPILDGRYVLSELIGIGGFASVWEAHDVYMDQIVAIKCGNEKYLIREYATQSKLEHPNIVGCSSRVAWEDGQGMGLVMERMDTDLSVTLVSCEKCVCKPP